MMNYTRSTDHKERTRKRHSNQAEQGKHGSKSNEAVGKSHITIIMDVAYKERGGQREGTHHDNNHELAKTSACVCAGARGCV